MNGWQAYVQLFVLLSEHSPDINNSSPCRIYTGRNPCILINIAENIPLITLFGEPGTKHERSHA